MLTQIYAKLGREEVKKVNRGITMLNYSKAEPMGVLKDFLCQVGVTTIIAKFLILDMPIDKDAPILVNKGFLYTCGSILNTRDRELTSTFGRVCHQTFRAAKTSLTLKKIDSFLGALLVPLQHMEWKPNYEGNLCKKEKGMDHAKIRLTDPYGNMYDQDWNVLNTLGCGNAIEDMLEVRVNEMGSNEVLFTSKAWKRAFDINEPIYTELCYEFYATFEFDKAVADDTLMTKKAIKFRVCDKAYAMSILDFAKRLGLYTGAKIQEYGYETYFIGGLRNDDDFSADKYWLNISSEETLTLSRSPAKTIRKPVLKVLQK
ncbi:hypothetical protein Tco_0743158 [Tanacetum coccineum]